MPFSLSSLVLFLTAVSLDSLTAGFSYGTDEVHIKLPALLPLALVPALFITAAQGLGAFVGSFLPGGILPCLSFLLLFLIGTAKLLESLIRLLAKKRPSLMGNWGCKIKQLNIIFTVYLSPEDANQDDLQVLSPKEALLLSLALSLDSVLAGMAFTTGSFPLAALFLLAALFNLLLFAAGYGIGLLASKVFRIDLSWLSGLFLLLLAALSIT